MARGTRPGGGTGEDPGDVAESGAERRAQVRREREEAEKGDRQP